MADLRCRPYRSGPPAGRIAWAALLLLGSPLACRAAAGAPEARDGSAVRCGDRQIACAGRCCRANERCLAGACRCPGMLCGDRCLPPLLSCAVVVRSQQGDRCFGGPTDIACGPRKPPPDLESCEIGVVSRELVDSIDACTPARFRALTAVACAAYRQKNASRPLDEFDPSRPIAVTRHLDRFDGGGSLVQGFELPGTFTCPPPADRVRRGRPRR